MTAKQPPLLRRSPLTGSVYLITRYREKDGTATALAKVDITTEYQALESLAVAEEREACAKIADLEASACAMHARATKGAGRVPVSRMHTAADGVCRVIAATVRKRGGE